MRFSIRTLLICTFAIAAVFASAIGYKAVWRRHCEQLEPSLFSFLIEIESEAASINCFAFGNPVDANWTAPSRELLEKLESRDVLTGGDKRNDDVIFFVREINWIDWDTVTLDYGVYCSASEGRSIDRATLLHSDGEWTFTDTGSLWMVTDNACRF